MDIKLGAMTRVFSKCPVEEALRRIANTGLKYTALLGQHQGRRPLHENMTDADVSSLRKVLDQNGLTALMAWNGGVDPENLVPTQTRINRCAELGIGTLLMLGPRANLAQSSDASLDFLPGERERFADALGQLRDYAAPLGVKLAVKPHGGPTGLAAGLARLVQTPAAAGVGVFYDPGNLLFYMGLNPETDLPAVAKNVIGLCVKDHHGPIGASDFPVPGTGDVNWERVLNILAQEKFQGPALVEVLPGADPDEVEANLRAAITYLEKVIAES